MPDVFYRFRPINALLDGFNELENQEIYFASPEELNDPMENFMDIYWHGDVVVWKNLFKHYILCLERVCSLFIISGDIDQFNKSDIPIFLSEEDLPTSHKELIKEIYNIFLKNDLINQYIINLSNRINPVRRNELIYHSRNIHYYALDVIFSVYENHALIPKRKNIDSFREMNKLLEKVNSVNLINELEKEHPENKDMFDTIYSTLLNGYFEFELTNRFNDLTSNKEKNRIFIFLKFPEQYTEQIEKIVYPDWYTACFMANCTNSSIWGHYGDKHKGACLIFKTIQEKDNAFINLYGINGWNSSGPIYGNIKHQFYKINYINEFVEIDFFRSLGRFSIPVLQKYWYSNEEGLISSCADDIFNSKEQWRKNYWAYFYEIIRTKIKDWEYEDEYRLILNDMLSGHSNSSDRKLKYNFNDLVGIIFGIKTPIEDKLKIISIIESKCKKENRKDFKFYQAYYSKQKGKIDYTELSLINFK